MENENKRTIIKQTQNFTRDVDTDKNNVPPNKEENTKENKQTE